MRALEPTGERLVPESADSQLLAEHLARYRFAAAVTDRGRVLDLGCGAGYGMAILAARGASVVGIDVSIEAAVHAAHRRGGPLVVADGQALPFSDDSFERVVAFELIEHVPRPRALVGEVLRVLRADGVAILSTPNRTTYVDEAAGPANPFHLRELYRGELEAMLRASFAEVRLYGQAIVEAVAIEALSGAPAEHRVERLDGPEASVPLAGTPEPDYFLAVCWRRSRTVGWPRSTLYLAATEVLRRLRRERLGAERDLDEKRAWALRLRDEVAVLEAELRRMQDQLDEARARALRLEGLLRRRARKGAKTKPRDPGAEDDHRALLVAACPADVLDRLMPVVRVMVAGGPLTCVITERQIDTREYLRTEAVSLTVLPAGVVPQLRAILRLRGEGYEQTFVSFTGHGGFRRLKLAGLLAGWPLPVVVDERGTAFLAGARSLAAHLRRRVGDLAGSWLQQLRSALRLLRQSGWRVTLRRIVDRSALRTLPIAFRQRLVTLTWPSRALSFPVAPAPLVSIIIPARDRWRLTVRCLRSLRRHTHGVPYEVILVDDGSQDATRRAESHVAGIRVVHQPENRGFIDACNRGVESARGRFLLFLNNDVEATKGWLPALLATFEGRPRCGAVGAKLVSPSGRLQEAGGIVWRDGTAWNCGRDGDPEAPQYNYCRAVDYCSAAALLVRRDAWERVGGFDPRFAPAYWEDVDLAFSLREAGLEVWYQPACALRHLEGVSAGRNPRAGVKRFQAVNQPKFRDKWASRLGEQMPFDPRRLFVARDRNDGPLVMVFDYYVPTPDRDAGSLVMDEMLATLVDDGYRVVFWPDNLYPLPRHTQRLQQRGVEVVYGRVDVPAYLERLSRRIEVAIAYRAGIAERYLPQVRHFADALGYVAADLEHLREARRGAVEGGAAEHVEALRQREARLVALVDCVAVLSPVERAVLESEFGARRVLELPFPALPRPRPRREPPFEERRDLLFVGSTHPPNVDGLMHFVSAVLPLVQRALPDVLLHVVGEVCERVPALGRVPGVRLVGPVDDVDEWLARARVFVAPLRFGAGIKGKIVASLAAGVPVVTTSVGAEGLGLVHGKSAMIADDDLLFAQATARLHEDATLWAGLRHAGMNLAASGHSRERFRGAVRELMEELLRAGGNRGARERRRARSV